MNDMLVSKAQGLARRPYQIEIEREPGELSPETPRYTACIKEMPYCVAQGFTEEEARKEIGSVLVDYILSLLSRNLDVPKPEAMNCVDESEYAIHWPWQGCFVHAKRSLLEQLTSPKQQFRTIIYAQHSE